MILCDLWRASKRVLTPANRREGIQDLCRLLESIGRKAERQRPDQKAAGNGLPAAAEARTGIAASKAGIVIAAGPFTNLSGAEAQDKMTVSVVFW